MSFNTIYGTLHRFLPVPVLNVFGRRQAPDGTYAAVMTRFIKRLLMQSGDRSCAKLRAGTAVKTGNLME
jgi:hypothetical protein